MPYKDPEKRKAVKAKYRETHRELLRAKGREYARRTSDERSEYRRKYREDNKEIRAAKYAEYHAAHPEKARARGRKYYARHAQKCRAMHRSWMERHPENCRMHANKRRASKKHVGGSYTVKQWFALKEQYNFTCLCCHRREPEIKLTADHVIPLSKGGANSVDNLQPLCLRCNCRKKIQTTDYRPDVLTTAAVLCEAA